MPIKVDEAYLRHVIDILNSQIAGEVVAAPGGAIDAVKVKAGFAIPPGENLEGAVTNQGSAVHKILLDIGNLATNRASQLTTFITMTNDTEQLAKTTAADFGNRIPGWLPGGKSTT